MSEVTLPKTLKIADELNNHSDFIHVVVGPRQVGKTTALSQIQSLVNKSSKMISADGEVLRSPAWLQIEWDQALDENIELLIIDEIQKVENWSERIKKIWDQNKSQISLVLLGSSSIEIHKGLSESLAGRFKLHPFYHWDFEETLLLNPETTLKQYLRFGGYPGSYSIISDLVEWLSYIKYSIIDPVIGKDILSLVHVKSPALFKQCFDLICSYAAQEISYTKLLGQLQDKGNTDLVKHYISLFEAAFLVKSLEKFSAKATKKRCSSPKLLPLCPALYSVTIDADYDQNDFGRAFEVMIGSMLNKLPGELYYWRERNFEVDFVYQFGKSIHAIEVKWGKDRSTKGLEKFLQHFPNAKTHLVTPENFQEIIGKLEK